MKGQVTILEGDVRVRLADMPNDSVDCVVTSPPYWGLRDYGTATWEGGDPDCDHRSPTMREGRDEQRAALAGSAATNSAQLLLAHRTGCGKCGAVKVDRQIGLEPTLGEHLDVMVRVMREVRRVLKPTGTLWLNYGDCYATSPNGRSAADTKAAGTDDRTFRDKPFSTIGPIYQADARGEDRRGARSTLEGPQTLHTPGRIAAGGYLKAKDLCMVPNRLAIALQEDGWWVRSEIIWAKPNPMPESITDRPATAHEKIFLLSKAPRYHYDAEAVRQGVAEATVARLDQDLDGQSGSSRANGGSRPDRPLKAVARLPVPAGWDVSTGEGQHGKVHRSGRRQDAIAEAAGASSSSRRMAGFNDRWAEQGGRAKADSFARKHKASAGDHGQKPQHRPQREEVSYPRGEGRNLRNYEPAPVQVWHISTAAFSEAHFATFPPELAERCLLAGCPKGGTVLDPFGGAGTVGLVAARMGLDCTLIELNPKYASLTRRRLRAGLVKVDGPIETVGAPAVKPGDTDWLFRESDVEGEVAA